MATSNYTTEAENPFEADVTGLNVVGVQPGAFDKALEIESQRQIAKLTKPSIETEVPEMKLPTEAQIAVKRDPLELQTFDLLGLKEDDAESATDPYGIKVNIPRPDIPKSTTELPDYRRDLTKSPTIKSIGASGKDTDKAPVEEPEVPNFGLEPDLDALYDKVIDKTYDYGSQGVDYLKDLYQNAFGPDYAGQAMQTVPNVLGQGYNLAKYTTPFQTGLTSTSSQSAIGLSGAPPASLAGTNTTVLGSMSNLPFQGSQWANQALLGQVSGGGYGGLASSSATGASQLATSGAGVNALGQPMYGSTAASGAGRSVFGSAASIYGIYSGIKNKDYFSAGASLITLINPATAIPMAVIMGAKALFGAWSASKRQKPAFGGAEFKATNNSLMATGGWGYNAYNKNAGKATVASVADYVNSYTKHFGLNFNGNKWAGAIAADPKLNRFDSTNESGYGDPSLLSRKIFETQGLITGNPTVNGVAITSQEDYKEKMVQFNDWYKKTALDRGGLVDAQRVGIDPNSLSNEYKQITYKDSTQVGGGGTGRNYTTRTTGGGRGGGGTTQTGYYQQGPGRSGQSTWVPAPSNVVVDQGYYGSTAHAINYRYEDAAPHEMLYRNLVGSFQTGQGGTYY